MITAELMIPHSITLHSLGAHIVLIDDLHSIPPRYGNIVAFAIEATGAKVLGPAFQIWLGVLIYTAYQW
jgi:hypothetical protein